MSLTFQGIQGNVQPVTVNLRCPFCRHIGAFQGIHGSTDVAWVGAEASTSAQFSSGVRACPNPKCGHLVFVVLRRGGNLITSYPPEIIDFDASNLPPRILETLEEAIKAHGAGCFKASALMVRRVLEELCRDKNATGDNLKTRLMALGSNIFIPQELLSAADGLRLLGNDAAHVEAKAYDNIGHDEATLAIELAKELLKAVYQYSSLVTKLKALKKP